jgi:Holliday junction resolvase RusA-like endonuclease
VNLFVDLEPIGKGRPRAGMRRGGHAVLYTPSKTAAWEDAACVSIMRQARGEVVRGPVAVSIVAVFSRTKAQLACDRLGNVKAGTERLWHAKKPDADNVAKITLDALVRAGVLEDDCTVVYQTIRKVIRAVDERPGIYIDITAVDHSPRREQ